jgi:hypothetical protein
MLAAERLERWCTPVDDSPPNSDNAADASAKAASSLRTSGLVLQ